MTADKLAAARFEAAYAERSGITVDELRRLGRVVAPCDCGDDMCEGWQSMSALTAARERHVAGPYSEVNEDGDPLCDGCKQPWPCDAARFRDALDKAEAKIGKTWGTIIDTHRAELNRFRTLADELAEALESCMNEQADWETCTAALAKWEASR